MNITEEIGKYLKEYAVQLSIDGILGNTDFSRTEGEMRDHCYNEIGNLFDDAMNEFTLSDVIDDACEELKQEIKNLLYERTGDECTDEDAIDEEIGKLERQIARLKELEDV